MVWLFRRIKTCKVHDPIFGTERHMYLYKIVKDHIAIIRLWSKINSKIHIHTVLVFIWTSSITGLIRLQLLAFSFLKQFLALKSSKIERGQISQKFIGEWEWCCTLFVRLSHFQVRKLERTISKLYKNGFSMFLFRSILCRHIHTNFHPYDESFQFMN